MLSLTPLPIKVDATTKLAVLNSHYNDRKNIRLRLLAYLIGIAIAIVLSYRLCWLFVNWEGYTFYHREEAIIYLMLLNGLFLYVGFSYTYQVQVSTWIFVINQILLLGRQKKSFRSSMKLYRECLVYGFAAGGLLMIAVLSMGPFVLAYCPVQLMIGCNLPSKMLGSILYTLIGVDVVPTCFSFWLISLTVLEGLIDLSNKLKHRHLNVLDPATKFLNSYNIYKELRVLLVATAEPVELLFTGVILVGIFLSSCTGYATIDMYMQLNVLVYCLVFIVFCMGILVAILFTTLASIPARNVEKFCKFWGIVLRKKLCRLLLRTIPPMGIKLGPYGIVSCKMGLLICEDILNNVINLLMIQT